MQIEGIEFDTTGEAIQYTHAAGHGTAIRAGVRNLVIRQDDAERMAAAGVEFAYLCDHKGHIVTIPVDRRAHGRSP